MNSNNIIVVEKGGIVEQGDYQSLIGMGGAFGHLVQYENLVEENEQKESKLKNEI